MSVLIYDLINLFIDDSQDIRVYDLAQEAKIVYEGEARNVLPEIEFEAISSIDNINPDSDGYIGININ